MYWDAAQKRVILKEGVKETEGGAYGYFNDSLHLTGWSILEICAGYGSVQQRDETTFFLAGYLEGYFTAGSEDRIRFYGVTLFKSAEVLNTTQ